MQTQIDQRFIQGTAEWHALRKTKVTATDAAPILGVAYRKTVLEAYNDKLSSAVSTYDNEDMKRGRDLEKQALAKFEDITSYLMTSKVVLHPTIDYMMASLDGMELSGKAIVEIKCPRPEGKSHEMAMSGEIPSYYVPQLMHQMECSGLKKAYYFSYTLTSYKILELHYDEKYIQNLLKEEAEFWNCVITKTEPKSKKNYIHMDSKEWTDAAQNYRDIDRQIKALEKRKQAYKDSLFAIADGKQSTGADVTISKITRKGVVDIEALASNEKINIEKYRKPSKEEWRLT